MSCEVIKTAPGRGRFGLEGEEKRWDRCAVVGEDGLVVRRERVTIF